MAKSSLPKNVATEAHYYRSAIEYGLTQIKGAAGQVSWLNDFMEGSEMAIADVEAYMHQRPGSFKRPALRGPVKRNGIYQAPKRVDVDDL